jgi:adenylylsulfate kinase-like enzyme
LNSGEFFEVFINTPLAVCEQRDPKGLYKKARSGEIPNFTGISDPYEEPTSPDLEILTEDLSVDEAAGQIISLLEAHKKISRVK